MFQRVPAAPRVRVPVGVLGPGLSGVLAPALLHGHPHPLLQDTPGYIIPQVVCIYMLHQEAGHIICRINSE